MAQNDQFGGRKAVLFIYSVSVHCISMCAKLGTDARNMGLMRPLTPLGKDLC